MAEMIERVARAMCLADGLDPDADWRIMNPESRGGVVLDIALEDPARWITYIRKARAAIEAMAKPTEAMVERGILEADACNDGADIAACTAEHTWSGMITAALSPTGG